MPFSLIAKIPFQSIAAIVAGYLVMAVTTVITMAWTTSLLLPKQTKPNTNTSSASTPLPQQKPTTFYTLVNAIFGFVSAILGGITSTYIGPNNGIETYILSGIVFLFGFLYMFDEVFRRKRRDVAPLWYHICLIAFGTIGTIYGDYLAKVYVLKSGY